jgi:FAD/FMN-containing dehydrogenase
MRESCFRGLSGNLEDREPVLDETTRWALQCPACGHTDYLEWLPEEGDETLRATFGANYDRLAACKHTYDPTNLFRLNQNISPATRGGQR